MWGSLYEALRSDIKYSELRQITTVFAWNALDSSALGRFLSVTLCVCFARWKADAAQQFFDKRITILSLCESKHWLFYVSPVCAHNVSLLVAFQFQFSSLCMEFTVARNNTLLLSTLHRLFFSLFFLLLLFSWFVYFKLMFSFCFLCVSLIKYAFWAFYLIICLSLFLFRSKLFNGLWFVTINEYRLPGECEC